MQSWVVTMLNAIASNALGAEVTCKIPSLALMMLFTWWKTSSSGIKSGEQGDKKISFDWATLSIKCTTGPTWWTEQLSIITTYLGLVPSNGLRIGISVSVTNSSNCLHSLILQLAAHHVCLPLTSLLFLSTALLELKACDHEVVCSSHYRDHGHQQYANTKLYGKTDWKRLKRLGRLWRLVEIHECNV